jgi:hypothetical protein
LPRPGTIYHDAEGIFVAAFRLSRNSESVPQIVRGSAKRPDPLHFARNDFHGGPFLLTA